MKFLIRWNNSPATIDAALETIARLDWSQVDTLGESLGVNHVTTYYQNDFSGFSVVEAADLATVTHFCRLFPGSMIEPVFDRDEAAAVAKRIVETRQQLPTAGAFADAALPEDEDREPEKVTSTYWPGARQKTCVGGPARQAAKVASQAETGLDAPPAFADLPSLLNERLFLGETSSSPREVFDTLLEAKLLFDRSRKACNTVRPHSLLVCRPLTPESRNPVPGLPSG